MTLRPIPEPSEQAVAISPANRERLRKAQEEWRAMVVNLGLIWAREYRRSGPAQAAFRQTFRNYASPCEQLAYVYGVLSAQGLLEPVERLERETKEDLWAEAKAWRPAATQAETIKTAKALWALNYLIHTYNL